MVSSRQPDWTHIGYTVRMTVLGAAVGAAAILANSLSSTPVAGEPDEARALWRVLMVAGGALSGALITAPIIHRLYPDRPPHEPDQFRKTFSLAECAGLGLGYAIVFPPLAGGIVLPLAAQLFGILQGLLGAGDIFYSLVDTMFLAPLRAVISLISLMVTTAMAGLVFGTGLAILDRLTPSKEPKTPARTAWVAAIVLALGVLIGASFGPTSIFVSFSEVFRGTY
ncbi:MAG: hypothetical protein O3A47_02060 [Chloroflexi bacterium]|nr:hypothetical protein [Chloroflexota bacterium]